MKTIHWNLPFQFCVAIYDGDDLDVQKAKELLTKGKFKYKETVNGRRHELTVVVTLDDVHKAVNIFKKQISQ